MVTACPATVSHTAAIKLCQFTTRQMSLKNLTEFNK